MQNIFNKIQSLRGFKVIACRFTLHLANKNKLKELLLVDLV